MHFYPHHVGDYRSATAHLSNQEDLAYRRLLEMYYDTERPISADTQWVSRRLRVGSDELIAVLNDFFVLCDDGYHNARCDIEIAQYTKKAHTARTNGKNGGRRKLLETLPKNPVGSNPEPMANPGITQALANQEPRTKNQEPHIPPISPRGELPENGFKQFWDEYGLKVARPLAVKAFAAAIKKTDMQTILAGVKQYKTSIAASGFSQAHPSSWLNAERWLDEPQRIENGKQHAPDRADIKPGNKTDRLNAAIQRAVANSAHITGFGGPGEPGADTRPMLPGPESVRKGAGTDRSDDRFASNGVSELFD